LLRIPALLGAAALLATLSGVRADDHAEARFRGTGKADPVRIENVRRVEGPAAGRSSVTFDLAWDHSWRAAWEVSAEQTGGKGPLKLESWDAAWVFVKFRSPGGEWSHATLATRAADHRVPAGAALEVGLTDDGQRGVGVFVYRNAVGHGPNDFRGLTLRWRHGADAPGAVGLEVFAIEMVHVPQCAFWVGDGATDREAGQFSAGDSDGPFRIESERALLLRGNNTEKLGYGDVLDEDGRMHVACRPLLLPTRFPKGFAGFYCMKYEITQKQYVDFLNTLPYGKQAARTVEKPSAAAGALALSNASKSGPQRNGIRIAVPGVPDSVTPVVYQRGSFVASGALRKAGAPAAYKTDAPCVACNFLSHEDGAAFAAWAGLRPMTELEFEKACRGPLRPVPNEFAWGTAGIAGTDSKKGQYTLQNAGRPDESVVWTGDDGPDATRGNAPSLKTNHALGGPVRVGVFVTRDSDRVRAGASFWGILDLTGNVMERAVPVSSDTGRTFAGNHGGGGDSPWKAIGFGMRGGGYPHGSDVATWGGDEAYRTSNRAVAASSWVYEGARHSALGFRCVRTAP
jgi:formylglycine-generating enzyme required for sulfatase activity